MAEFIFTCPQCRQPVQCDSACSGSPITCPNCQNSITVPPATPPERVIQIKVSTLRNITLIGAGVFAAVVLVLLVMHFLQPRRVTFRASIDGTDIVKICGAKLWIEHQDFQLPTLMHINNQKWNPAWDGNISANYELRRALRPGSPDDIKLVKRSGRGTVSILEMPSPANHQTLAVQLDDGPYGGAAFYEFTLTW